MSKEKRLQIRNSTAEFLVFTRQAGEDGIEVRVQDETVWLTQKLMAALFDVDVRTINEHLGNIYQSGELRREATIRNFRIVRREGEREVSRDVEHYNLDAIIAVGFRVNSARATQFRQWAIAVLRDFAIRGYVLDKERLKNGGSILGKKYFNQGMNRFSIPTGLHHPAQGCRVREATLGQAFGMIPTLKGLQPCARHLLQPLQGCDVLLGLPRVGVPRLSGSDHQPWADGCNPVGVARARCRAEAIPARRRMDGHLKEMGAVWK